MAYDGTINLDEDKVKEIIRKHLEDSGYTMADVDEPIRFKINKGHDGGRFGGYTSPSFNKAVIQIKV